MLAPKRVKWRKQQKGKMRGKADRGATLHFGDFGLVATTCGKITSRQIEAARVAMSRYIKRGGNIWIRIFPHKPLTKKPAETRMGSGKGGVEDWVAVVKPGRILFEMAGIPREDAIGAMKLANYKLPLHCKPISRTDDEIKKRTATMAPMRQTKAAREAAAPAPAKPAEGAAEAAPAKADAKAADAKAKK